jgi:pilus assembly protein Flp/PilA
MQLINDLMIDMLVRWDNLMARTKDEDGQTLVEYGLIIALISIAAIGIMATVGTNVKNVFTSVSGKLHS